MNPPRPLVVNNPWQQLRRFTAARIALGRSGVSQPTAPHLAFQLAHAQARDAVHLPLDVAQLRQGLADSGFAGAADGLLLESAAADRLTYLQRPDLGRRLSAASRAAMAADPRCAPGGAFDLALVIADGLSAQAVARHAPPLLAALMRRLAAETWSMAPLAIVRLGRVAVADEVAERLGARLVVLMIGERPGLSSPDSLGLYATWAPRVGLNDSARNCISNVRPAGLGFDEAAARLHYLMTEMRRRELSGVALKDETAAESSALSAPRENFLLGRS
jgi:ethanolamine ammonia-lyase small subunit